MLFKFGCGDHCFASRMLQRHRARRLVALCFAFVLSLCPNVFEHTTSFVFGPTHGSFPALSSNAKSEQASNDFSGRRDVIVGGAITSGISCVEGAANAEARVAASAASASILFRCDAQQNRLTVADAEVPRLLRSDLVLCGEHHNSENDHVLELELLRGMSDAAKADGVPLTVGLEMVERQFQPVLDKYLGGKLSDDELYAETQWATRWVWPWEYYLPIFQFAKARSVPLVALNPDSEVRKKIPVEGLEALSAEERADLVPDPKGFFGHNSLPYFLNYTALVIMPSYGLHVSAEFVDKRTSARNFFAARTLRDEAMASGFANSVTRRGGRGLLLVGADHVRYEYGVARRVKRYAPEARVVSVLLNPSPRDTLSPNEEGLSLSMGNESDAPPLSDFILFSKPA